MSSTVVQTNPKLSYSYNTQKNPYGVSLTLD